MNRPDDGGSEEDCEEELFEKMALAEGGRRYRTFSIGKQRALQATALTIVLSAMDEPGNESECEENRLTLDERHGPSI